MKKIQHFPLKKTAASLFKFNNKKLYKNDSLLGDGIESTQ